MQISNLNELERIGIFVGKYSSETGKVYFQLVELLTRLWDRRVAEVTHDLHPIQPEEFLQEVKSLSNKLSAQTAALVTYR